jgi:hypothetical protein
MQHALEKLPEIAANGHICPPRSCWSPAGLVYRVTSAYDDDRFT